MEAMIDLEVGGGKCLATGWGRGGGRQKKKPRSIHETDRGLFLQESSNAVGEHRGRVQGVDRAAVFSGRNREGPGEKGLEAVLRLRA
jgi:hypothetical protein